MMTRRKRSQKSELIDLGPEHYTPQEYQECLLQLDRIGRLLGGDRATFWAFKQLKESPSSILDVGCGGGHLTRRVASRYPHARVTGIDISEEAIHFAQAQHDRCRSDLPNLNFLIPSSPTLDSISQKYDVVMATLVCHHFSDETLIDFLQQASRIANKTVIINDLHRNFLASIGFASLVPILFSNRLIWHDGLLSIKRAFKRSDWIWYLEQAGIDSQCYKVTWHWAFRWIVMIDTSHKGGKNEG